MRHTALASEAGQHASTALVQAASTRACRGDSESLPHTTGSVLRLDLAVDGAVLTGSWSEQTSPTGYYRGATYHGSWQLIVDPLGRSMAGKWLGFGSGFKVNTGEWEMTWVDGPPSRRRMRQYALKE